MKKLQLGDLGELFLRFFLLIFKDHFCILSIYKTSNCLLWAIFGDNDDDDDDDDDDDGDDDDDDDDDDDNDDDGGGGGGDGYV